MDKDTKRRMEDRFRGYPNYLKEIQYRKWDLEHKQADFNAGIKSIGRTSNPQESLVIKWESDPYIANRQLWIKSIDEVLAELDDKQREMVKEYYFEDCYTYTELAKKYSDGKEKEERISHMTVYRICTRACKLLAEKIGEII